MPLAGWTYYQNLTDASGTTLTNYPVRAILSGNNSATSSGFRFDLCKADGSDIRIYDETSSTLAPYWLMDFNPVASSCQIFFLASDTTHTFSVNYGSGSASSSSNFSSVFSTGTGFDTDFGTLSTAIAGGGIANTLTAATGITDQRYRRLWTRRSNPVITATGISSSWQFVSGFDLLKDTDGVVVKESGVYVGYVGVRNSNLGGSIIRALSSDGLSWGNFTTAVSSGLAGVDGSVAINPFVYKVASGDYRMWYQAANSVNDRNSIAYATSVDGATWSKQGVVLNGVNGSAAISGNNLGSFGVTKLSDGSTYMGVANASSGSLSVMLYGWVSPDLINWTSLNGGNSLFDLPLTGFDAGSARTPRIISLNNNVILIEYVGSSGLANAFTGIQIGFISATSSGGPWVRDTNNPVMGYPFLQNEGVSPACIVLDTDKKKFIHYHQESGGAWGARSIFRSYEVPNKGGFVKSTTTTDGSVAGQLLDRDSSFSATSYSWMTAGRSENAGLNILSICDTSGLSAPIASAAHGAAKRIEIQRSTYDAISPGSLFICHYSGAALTRNFWNGSAWTTATSRISTDISRPLVANVKYDGTNFLLNTYYADDGSSIATAGVAKATLATFVSGKTLFVGDLFTDAWAGSNLFRYITVGPYTSTDPSIIVGALQSQGGSGGSTPSGIISVKTIFGGTNLLCYMGAFNQ